MLIGKGLNYIRDNGITATLVKIGEYRRYRKSAVSYMREYTIDMEDITKQRSKIWDRDVTISLVMPVYNTQREYLEELLESVMTQTYENWELCVADASDKEHGYVGEILTSAAEKDSRIKYKKLERNKSIAENTNEAIAMATGEYIGLLDHDDLLNPTALYEYREAIDRGADFIYCDELSFEEDINKPKVVHFKPDFAVDNLRGNNYICHLSVFKKSLIDKVGGLRKEYDGSQDHDIILRLTEQAEKIVHIPKVLYYWRVHDKSVAKDISAKPYCLTSGKKAVGDHLKRVGLEGKAEDAEGGVSAYRVNYKVVRMPSITRVDRATNYNVEKSKNEYIAITDKNIELIGEGWKKELAMLVMRDDVGMAGGKLLKGKRIWSAGVIIGGENGYKYAYKGIHNSSAGYMKKLKYIQDVNALASGVIMVRKSLIEELGGFDERLRGDERIIDMALRMREKGLLVVMNPYVEGHIIGRPRRIEGASAHFKAKWSNRINGNDEYFSNELQKYIMN